MKNLHQMIVFILIYNLPSFILAYLTVAVIVRNPRKIEHWLASAVVFCFLTMFMGEMIRQMLPISYSPSIAMNWLGNFGAASASFGLHLYFKITKKYHHIPGWLYLIISYLFVAPSIISLVLQKNLYNSESFYHKGIWIYPVYNQSFHVAMTISMSVTLLEMLLSGIAFTHGKTNMERGKFLSLFLGATLITFSNFFFGVLINIFPTSLLPPNPYLFGDAIWILFLTVSILKYNFLPSYTKRYHALFNLAPNAIIIVAKNGAISEMNPSAIAHFGEQPISFLDLFSTAEKDQIAESLFLSFLEKSKWSGIESAMVDQSGSPFPVLIDSDFVEIENHIQELFVIRDISERKQLEYTMRQLAYYDPLTNLSNRRKLMEDLDLMILESDLSRSSFAVFFIDLDGFKQINDEYGHAMGDEVLVQVADTLRQFSGYGDCVARIGGDEFIFVLHQYDPCDGTPLSHVASDLHYSLKQTFHENGHHYLSASIGISIFPDQAENSKTLLEKADEAMYQIKNHGKNGFMVRH